MNVRARQAVEAKNAVYPAQAPRPMPRSLRLLRWAELLDRTDNAMLRALHKTEFRPRTVRSRLRNDYSPLSIAFADPVLRAHGLAGETYGDAQAFFELRDRTLHNVLCYCHYISGAVLPAAEVAARVRTVAHRASQSEHLTRLLRLRGTRLAAYLERLFA